MSIDRARLAAAAAHGHATATDLADWLVRDKEVPFRDAHRIAARAVLRAEALGTDLGSLSLAELQEIDPRFDDTVYQVLTIERSVASRTSFGGTAPVRVREAIGAARERFL